MTETDAGALVFDTDPCGNRRLADRRFDGATFPDLQLHPQPGTEWILERVVFSGCHTNPGTCWISRGTTLRDVVIEDLNCGDALWISSNCQLERVILKRRKRTGRLSVRPFEGDDPQFRQRADDWCLDITGFHGHEVEVFGVPVSRIRFDPTRQVVVRRDWRTAFDWDAIGLKRLGFFGIVTAQLVAHQVGEGIVSLPAASRNLARYEEARREMEILRRAGAVFS